MSERSWSTEILKHFVVFEGVDGAGTTTQAQRLVDHINKNSRGPAEFTCEPTDFVTGTVIRTAIRGPEFVRAETLALLFAADRNEHLYRPETGVLARLEAGTLIVCDRYLFSSLAYQGAFADYGYVAGLNAGFPLPEHLIFIDTSLDEADRRMRSRAHRDSLEQAHVQQRVADRYRAVIDGFSGTGNGFGPGGSAMQVHRIDGNQAPDAVFSSILVALDVR